MIRIRNLSFQYRHGPFRLVVPHLEVAEGGRIGFIGPSGSGKTTLLHLMAGICVPDQGEVEVGRTRVDRLGGAESRRFRAAHIGLVFQEFALLDYLSVLDNILLPYRLSPALKLEAAVRERGRDLARQVGLGDYLGVRPSRLSQGERQRVAICRALLPRPRLVLADEPTGNLDPTSKGKVMEILLEHSRASGATLVTVTHDHALLAPFDRVIDFAMFHASGESGAGGGGAS